MTLVASCVHVAGISASFCSNMALPDSSLIVALRSSQATVSKGSATSVGQKTESMRSPLERSRIPSSLAVLDTGAFVRGAVTLAMHQLLLGVCRTNQVRRLPAKATKNSHERDGAT